MNLLIGEFPVPPFLMPIYKAAAIDYGVPWQTLAAINEIETDYGRNLSTSSAGAMGWMQFIPSTWARFGMDADGNGAANPYDPVDAIFAAARYLHAAGAEGNLPSAIYAYNHADWYVTSVELRAKLLQYLPQNLVDVLTGMMRASFPVAGHLGRYATQAPEPASVAGQPAVALSGPVGAPVIAAADGRVVSLGHNLRLGNYVTLEDSYGDRFTYSGLRNLESLYPELMPRVQSAVKLARELGAGSTAVPDGVLASATGAGASGSAPGAGGLGAVGGSGATSGSVAIGGTLPTTASSPGPRRAPTPPTAPMPKERLFAYPWRPASYGAGGRLQLRLSLSVYAAQADLQLNGRGAKDYFSQPVQLRPGEFTLAPLTRGAIVAAGTILGRVGRTGRGSGAITLQIRPAGAKAPVDPSPIVAGWQLLGRLTAGRASLVGAGQSAAFGASNPSIGQLLLAGKAELAQAVLSDPRVSLDACSRNDVQAGTVDRRVLAVIEYLSYSGLGPGVSGLGCGQAAGTTGGADPKLDISRLNGIPVAGHQADGAIVDLAIRRILALQGALRPSQIVSLRTYQGEPTTVALPDHAAQIEVDFSPTSSANGSGAGWLDSGQWDRLIGRLTQLSGEPGAAGTAPIGSAPSATIWPLPQAPGQ